MTISRAGAARWPAVAVVGLAVLVCATPAAAAAPVPPAAVPAPPVEARTVPEGAEVAVPGQDGTGDVAPPAAPSRGAAGSDTTTPAPPQPPGAAPAPTTTYARVPDCPGNLPGGGAQGNLCNGAILTCPDPDQVRYRLYARPAADPGAPWAGQGTQCLTDAQLAAAGAPGAGPAAAPVVVTQADLRRLPFAPGTSLLQPPGGQALVNVPLHVHGAAQAQVLPAVVGGAAVQVRATPTAYAWDFGDGATAGPSPDPGAPWPAPGHEHAYAAPGARTVTMSTTYAGEFSVGGGPWQPIDGDVTVVSPAQPVLARTARASLVGDLLG